MSLNSFPPGDSKNDGVLPEVSIGKDSHLQMNVETSNDDQLQEKVMRPVKVDQYFVQGWRLAIVVVSLCLGTLLVALDTTIIFVAVPRISTSFHSLEDIGWYGSAYLLTIMAFQASAAKIFKYFTVKVTYLISILIFEVGSILCASAPNSPAFIAGRAVAGIGSAGLFQGALCVIALCIRLERRPLYIGIVVSVFGIASCLGPMLGGALTDHLTWRWCFWINVPCGAVVLLLIVLFLKLPDANADRRLPLQEKLKYMDPLGTIILVGAISCLLLALQWGGQSLPWSSGKIIGLIVGFGVLVILFAIVEYKLGEKATIPLRFLRQRSILMGAGFLFFNQMSNYTNCYYLPFYFQAVQGTSVTLSGVHFLPLAAIQIVAVVLAGAVVSGTGHYVPYMILGEMICCVGTGLLTTISLGSSAAIWVTYLVITGLGLGIAMQLPYTAVQVVLSEADAPVGNGIAIFATQLGGAIAISVGQSVFVNTLLKEIPENTLAVSAQTVIDAGAANLVSLAGSSPQVLEALRIAYAKAVDNTLVLSLSAACMALPFAFGMEFLNVKTVAKQKKLDSQGLEAEQVKAEIR
ncbi:hypothetical protein MMC17_010085 [Xylographa soralifera]|nr:hypothetical protein [Xylographa soralifera]